MPSVAALLDSEMASASLAPPEFELQGGEGTHAVFWPSVRRIKFFAWVGSPCATNSSFAILIATPKFVLPDESIVVRSAWGLTYIISPLGGWLRRCAGHPMFARVKAVLSSESMCATRSGGMRFLLYFRSGGNRSICDLV